MARAKIITETMVNFVKDKKIADTTLLKRYCPHLKLSKTL